jgi:RNA polymerase sigma-70 factor (ECF subfamily)
MDSVELRIPTLGDDSDLDDLVARARDGSRSAFDALAARVRERIRGWASKLTHDPDDAEDVAQLVLLRLHGQIDEFEGRSRFTTWLYAVTKRVVLSQRAKERRRAALAESRVDDLSPARDAADLGIANIHRTGVESPGLGALVVSYLDVLSGREREVFELGDLRGLNASEISARLGVKAVTVRTQLMRARRKIRLRMLEERPELLEDYLE